MMRRLIGPFVLGFVLVGTAGSSHAQVATRNSSVHTKDSDRVLFYQGMKALDKSNYSEARSLLQRLINNYPESNYLVRAKLGIADSYYSQRAFKQAEREYRDFITFFPNMPEAVEAQRRIDIIERQSKDK